MFKGFVLLVCLKEEQSLPKAVHCPQPVCNWMCQLAGPWKPQDQWPQNWPSAKNEQVPAGHTWGLKATSYPALRCSVKPGQEQASFCWVLWCLGQACSVPTPKKSQSKFEKSKGSTEMQKSLSPPLDPPLMADHSTKERVSASCSSKNVKNRGGNWNFIFVSFFTRSEAKVYSIYKYYMKYK